MSAALSGASRAARAAAMCSHLRCCTPARTSKARRARWVPGENWVALGTDGFGRSDTRQALRRFFEVDAEHIAQAVLAELARCGQLEVAIARRAVESLGIDEVSASARLAEARPAPEVSVVVTVFIPEYIVGHWWEQVLHNQSALRLKARLLLLPGVIVASVPYQLRSASKAVSSFPVRAARAMA